MKPSNANLQNLSLVRTALEGLKIDGLELRTSAVELEPRLSDYRDDRVPEIVAYTATMMVYIKSKTPTDGPRLLTAGDARRRSLVRERICSTGLGSGGGTNASRLPSRPNARITRMRLVTWTDSPLSRRITVRLETPAS